MNILTLNEEMLLLVVFKLEDNAYGVTIMEKLREISGKNIVFGTLYNSLAKLKEKGYVETSLGEPTPERGGKSKVFYSMTKKGTEALLETRYFHQKLWRWMPDSGSGRK